jgi:hypothetical protein
MKVALRSVGEICLFLTALGLGLGGTVFVIDAAYKLAWSMP